MQKIEFIMGMPVIIEADASRTVFDEVFDYFRWVDEKFSPYKQTSEVTKINGEKLKIRNCSEEMQLILDLCEQTKKETNGYFDVFCNNSFDPSGLVKGWAINNAAKILEDKEYKDFYVEASGDIQTHGLKNGEKWKIGIKNPFDKNEIVKVVNLSGEGIATSGNYEKGNHIYNPNGVLKSNIISLTVIGKNVYEADRFATAAFAMGEDGIGFIEKMDRLEGYMINSGGIGTMTSGFEKYVKTN